MSTIVKVKAPKAGKDYEGIYEFGDTLEDAVAKFGDKAVFNGYIAEAKIALQGVIRDALNKGKTSEEIDAIVIEWKPGISRPRIAQDPMEAMMAKFLKMDDAGKRDFLQKLANAAGAEG
jgi:hypothetical protein